MDEKMRYDEVERWLAGNKTVECRVYPMNAQEWERLVPFRITVFAKTKFDQRERSDNRDFDVAICTEEPDVRTYEFGRTFIIGQPFVSSIRTALENLYERCLPIQGPWERGLC
jgi:hypothetical protein